MLASMGLAARELWPLALQHVTWTMRQATECRKMLVPAFGDAVTVRIKKTPQDDFAPRGKEMTFLGCIGEVTHGIIVGRHNGIDWEL